MIPVRDPGVSRMIVTPDAALCGGPLGVQACPEKRTPVLGRGDARRVASLAVLAFAWLPGLGSAAGVEDRPGTLELELTRAARPAVARPAPERKTAAEDAEQVTEAVRQRERDDALMRSLLPVPGRRPDLGHDLRGGIQSRNVRDALRAR